MERRLISRIEVPGALVQVKKSGSNALFSGLSRPQEMLNLSKGGICFYTNKRIAKDENIQMKLFFPDGKRLSLKGNVRWNNITDDSNLGAVGIQFNPFGTSNTYNPISSLDYLRSLNGLEQICLHPE